ncbi:SAM-dependent methyltransferase [Inquilinus ginsengisoli]|uniref:class I SAM-dependent methyltransferase n=1 Tax=Inquilinus ginsengisoli TaxID=363840 RepID=UPI003D1B3CBD
MVLNCADFYDAELRRHNEIFRSAVKAGRRDRVLDIGCGAGQSARDAARTAVEGRVLGVDVSAQMLDVARRRSAEEGLRNVVFEQGDAQRQVFPSAGFDLCISRFGAMFFADPAAAFANIGRAMRPGARLVWMVWQSQSRNEWSTAIQQALAPGTAMSATTAPAFSLSDPAITTEILNASGFGSVDFAEVHEPVFYGPDVDSAYEALTGLYMVKEPLARAGPEADAVLRRLRDLLEAHLTEDGVLFDSRAWIITAYRADG